MTGVPLVVALCLAHVLSLAGFGTFSALLPRFLDEWGLSNTEAGWISGIYFAGYASAVLVLVSLTDRIDSRLVYLASAALGALASFGFGWLADGFWSAFAFRALAGIGLAGTYMPGLKALTDRYAGQRQSRLVAIYTASFGIGVSLSVFAAGEIAERVHWRWAFALAGLGSLAALAVVAKAVAPHEPARQDGARRTHLLDLRPVLKNRAAMAYVLAYGAHWWDLLGLRSGIVVFLAFSQSLQPAGTAMWSATIIAAIVNLLGVPASIIGNEFAAILGRRKVAAWVMLASAVLAAVIGYSASLPYAVVVALFLVYGVTVTGDSAALTAGAVENAVAGQRGATMAVHSFSGFTTSFLGPLAFGVVLDLAGGNRSDLAWGLAFLAMGLGCALGPLALAVLG
ncbi:MAG: MFS transporter, partial [Alphaproteobacteria bacterium]